MQTTRSRGFSEPLPPAQPSYQDLLDKYYAQDPIHNEFQRKAPKKGGAGGGGGGGETKAAAKSAAGGGASAKAAAGGSSGGGAKTGGGGGGGMKVETKAETKSGPKPPATYVAALRFPSALAAALTVCTPFFRPKQKKSPWMEAQDPDSGATVRCLLVHSAAMADAVVRL